MGESYFTTAKENSMTAAKNQLAMLSDLEKGVLPLDTEKLVLFLNQDPPVEFIKKHPYIKKEAVDAKGQKTRVGVDYMPIDKVEYLLRVIFKKFRVVITGQGSSFNGVWVTVRVEYVDPLSGEWCSHDGIGAAELQTKKDSSPADLASINPGALSMAYPIAKSLAIKDACHHIGRIFGSDLNRNSEADLYRVEEEITDEEIEQLFDLKESAIEAKRYNNIKRIIENRERDSYPALKKYLSEL